MSRAIDRLRAKQEQRRRDSGAYNRGLDALSGDEGSSWGGALASLAQAGGEIADAQMKKKAAEKKAADDKAAALARDNAVKDAELKAENLRNVAIGKANEAQLAALHAQAEKEPYGPLHSRAIDAKNAADMADFEARKAEAKLATLKAAAPGSPEAMAALAQMQKDARGKGGMPAWGWVGLGLLGVGVVGGGGYLLLRKRR